MTRKDMAWRRQACVPVLDKWVWLYRRNSKLLCDIKRDLLLSMFIPTHMLEYLGVVLYSLLAISYIP